MKKKIAILAPTVYAFGGESRVITVIANELIKYYDVTIYTCEKEINKKNIYGLSKEIKVDHYFPYSRNPIKSVLRFIYRNTNSEFIEKHISIIKYAYYCRNAINKIKKTFGNDYSIVIAVSGNMTILLGKAELNKNGVRTIGWEHNSFEAYFETPHQYMWKREKIFIEAVSKLSNCVVLNEDISFKYAKNLGINCDVIYNPRSFVSSNKSELINKQFIACGRFVEAKGFDLLVESFRIFSEKDSEWNLILIGEGPMYHKIENKINEYNLQHRVKLTGYVENIKEYLLESSVYLLSSRWEGFPMCVTEAYEIGLPVICYDIPAMIPLIKNNEGIKVEKFNVKSFAEAMLKISSDVYLRKNMANNAIAMANSISIENITKQWIKLFENNGGE